MRIKTVSSGSRNSTTSITSKSCGRSQWAGMLEPRSYQRVQVFTKVDPGLLGPKPLTAFDLTMHTRGACSLLRPDDFEDSQVSYLQATTTSTDIVLQMSRLLWRRWEDNLRIDDILFRYSRSQQPRPEPQFAIASRLISDLMVLHLRDMMRSVDSSKIVAASSFPSHFKEHTERFAFKTQNDL
ncbi:hypothetical protein E6O75_ATG03590 [Venturia nashicola]|uniref:Uncharacterized protein n=1 Tax=Venturia nashicola TaxID=86259 RepID=A0A4Z1P8X0_9PEZI|nr:hypothetical protein E6O75_ATG03590 [Venturia nashicola]